MKPYGHYFWGSVHASFLDLVSGEGSLVAIFVDSEM